MIVSVSRRTDIPALYGKWFIERLKAGEVYQRNPFNPGQVHRIPLSKDEVDAFVFWTKNPAPFMPYLSYIKGYTYYFHVTLTPYHEDVEPAFKDKGHLLDAFKVLSGSIGAKRVIWRYDPVIITDRYTASWHKAQFERFAKALKGHSDRVVVSFVDFYKKAEAVLKALGAYDPPMETKKSLIRSFDAIARANGMTLELCSEAIDMREEGVQPSKCVDLERIEKLGGPILNLPKDPNQRKACGCVISKDIGMYDTCTLGCRYCYAVRSLDKARKAYKDYDSALPFLCGDFRDGDKVHEVKDRKR